jgi:hypothetical protein
MRTSLSVSCQRLPGERRVAGELRPVAEEEKAKGLPDGWIYWDDFALVIESKIKSSLTQAQLQRHLTRAANKGFRRVRTLVITAQERDPDWLAPLQGVERKRWPEVYGFLSRFVSAPHDHRNGIACYLSAQFLQYIRDIEARRKPGEDFILSSFQGIPFDEDKAFEPREAREVVRRLMPELRKQLAASKVLQTSTAPPKLRLTGGWDVIPLASVESGHFTDHPHLSVGIDGEGTTIAVILPNGAKGEYWRYLRKAGAQGLSECLHEVVRSFQPMRRNVRYGVEPRIMFQTLQRHFHGQSREVDDGRIRFDLDSLIEGATRGVKHHPGWIPAAWSIVGQTRRVNLQVELLALYPFSKTSVSHDSELIEELVRAAEAMKPFLDLLRGESHA